MKSSNSKLKTQKPLEGLLVLDFTWGLAGPFCTMLLCNFGARVLKIESTVGGDVMRTTYPIRNRQSGYFCSIHSGQESIAINLRDVKGKQIIKSLVKSADVVVENFRPGVMDGLGLGYKHLSEIKPSLVYASISGFGQNGPLCVRPAYDLIIQAMGGIMSVTGNSENNQLPTGVSQADMLAGIYQMSAIMVGLFHKLKTGRGTYIDVSMLECQVTLMFFQLALYSYTGIDPVPVGSRHPSAVPFDQYKCADCNIIIAVVTSDQWVRFCEAIGLSELSSDERFETIEARRSNIEELTKIINDHLSTKGYSEWAELLEIFDVPFARVNQISDLLSAEQIKYREAISEIEQSGFGKLLVTNVPYKMDGFDLSAKKRAPLYGEHTNDILKEFLKLGEAEITSLKASGVVV